MVDIFNEQPTNQTLNDSDTNQTVSNFDNIASVQNSSYLQSIDFDTLNSSKSFTSDNDFHQVKDVSHSSNHGNSLFVLYFNARSIKNKLDEFHARVYLDKPDIIAITESWLHDSFNAGEVFPSEYSVFRNDRNIHGWWGCFGY